MTTMSTVEVARETGATFRQLDHWCRMGLIDGLGAPGSGRRRRWTAEQVAEARRLTIVAWVVEPVSGPGHRGIEHPLLEVQRRMWDLVQRDPTGETWKP